MIILVQPSPLLGMEMGKGMGEALIQWPFLSILHHFWGLEWGGDGDGRGTHSMAILVQPVRLSDIPGHPISSQHDFLLDLGPPFAFAVDMSDAASVLNTIDKATASDTPIKPMIPKGFSQEDHKKSVATIFDEDFCSMKHL